MDEQALRSELDEALDDLDTLQGEVDRWRNEALTLREELSLTRARLQDALTALSGQELLPLEEVSRGH